MRPIRCGRRFDRLLDGDSLVHHTTQLMGGQYQRSRLIHRSVETVERWRKVDDNIIEAEVTIYDSAIPRQTVAGRARYSRVTTPASASAVGCARRNAITRSSKQGGPRTCSPGPGAGPIMKNKADK